MQFIDRLFIRIPPYARFRILQTLKYTPHSDLESHCYLTWKTGSGKSTYLLTLIYGWWYQTRKDNSIAIVVLDPHGDMVDTIKSFDLSSRYFERMMYVSPFLRKGYTPCINPMELDDKTKMSLDLMTQQLVRVFWELIPDAKLSNYMRALLKPCIYTLLNAGWTTLSNLQDFVSKNRYQERLSEWTRSRVLSHKKFFKNEFENRIYDWTKGSIYTKLLSLLNSETFCNMTSSWFSTVNLEKAVKDWKIVLFNLSKGRMGEEISETFWRLVIAQLQSIAIRRAKLPPWMRTKIYLVIDEADTFLSGNSLNVILKETRKYGLHLVLCTQNLISWRNQEALKRNILNNTNVKIVGSNGQWTLVPLSKEIGVKDSILLKTFRHEFRIKSWDKKTIKMRTTNFFWKHSPLLLSSHKIRKLNNRIIKNGGYYKPVPSDNVDLDWINDLPEDWRDKEMEKESPKSKFTL